MTMIVTNSFMRYLMWAELNLQTTIYISQNGSLIYTIDIHTP
jgi:predicted mannosyl-3-phosphoglycerate phosphatase (HAD superfamily)